MNYGDNAIVLIMVMTLNLASISLITLNEVDHKAMISHISKEHVHFKIDTNSEIRVHEILRVMVN